MEDYEVINMSTIPVIETGFEEFYILGFLGSQTGRALMSRLVGPAGKAVELSKNSTHLLWRYQGDPTWIEWVALADITGAAGKNPEFQKTATHIQWRLVGNTEWINLVALSDIKGDPGASPEFQKTATHIQWRLVGSPDWISLVPLSDIKGDPGKNFTIIANYATEAALRAAVPTPSVGDVYSIGESAPYNIYVYDLLIQDWKNYGPIQGAAGASSYVYIAYASNDQGADFSLTDGAYIAIKTTTTPIASPVADDFAGLWKHYKVTAAEVIAGVQVGGRNLIKGSDYVNNAQAWTSIPEVSTEGDVQYVRYGYGWAFSQAITLEPGIYVWSGLFRSSGANGIARASYSNGEVYLSGLTTNWKFRSITFEVTTNSVGFNFLAADSGGILVDFAKMKIERGNIATDWSPAPEDISANKIPKSNGSRLVDSSIIEIAGKVGIGNPPDADFDTVGSVLNRGSANHYRDVVMYSVNASPTGTAKITLPQFGNTIFSMRIFGCQNNVQAVWEVIIGGEMSSVGTIHVSLTRAQINGPAPFSSVRVGSDGTKPVILLGTTSTEWTYPHIVVTDFIASYINKSGFGSGWALDIISTESGLTAGAVAVSSLLNSNTLRVGVGSDYSSNPNALTRNYHGYVAGMNLFDQIDGGIINTWYSDEWQHQIFGDFRTGQLAVRGKQSDAWQPWRIVWDSGNLDPALLNFLTSQSTVTTLASLPISKRVIVATVTAATTLSLAAALEVGRELHIKVYNTSASAITQPLPTSSPFESKKVDGTNISSISIPAGGSVEISILSVTDKYIIKTDA